MFSRKSNGLLVHQHTDGTERNIKLRSDSVSVGSSRKSTVKLKGTYISDLHAEISRKKNGEWVVENRSPNGILVNGARVEQSVLRDGDKIQIGADDTLVVSGIQEVKGKESADQSAGDGKADKTKKGINPLYVLGGIVYAAVCLYLLAMFFEKDQADRVARASTFNLEQLESTVVQYSEYLAKKFDITIDPLYLKQVQNTDDITAKIEPLQSPEVLATSKDKSDWVKGTVQEVRSRFRNAYWLDQQGQIGASIDVLRSIAGMDSDITNPAAQYALGAIDRLQRKLSND